MMTHILHIDASARVAESASRKASARLVAQTNPDQVTHRDLATFPLPHITEAWVAARLVPQTEQTQHDQAILAQSDTLVAELMAADILVIGVPLYNFGMPASLKAWIDLIARPKVTFHYTSDGPEGLLTDKKAIVTLSSGGVPMGAPVDYATAHLRTFLHFLGITDITFVDAAEVLA